MERGELALRNADDAGDADDAEFAGAKVDVLPGDVPLVVDADRSRGRKISGGKPFDGEPLVN